MTDVKITIPVQAAQLWQWASDCPTRERLHYVQISRGGDTFTAVATDGTTLAKVAWSDLGGDNNLSTFYLRREDLKTIRSWKEGFIIEGGKAHQQRSGELTDVSAQLEILTNVDYPQWQQVMPQFSDEPREPAYFKVQYLKKMSDFVSKYWGKNQLLRVDLTKGWGSLTPALWEIEDEVSAQVIIMPYRS